MGVANRIVSRTNLYTRRANKDDTRQNAARLVVYRTKAGSDGPFYRITTPTSTQSSYDPELPDAPLENDQSVDTIAVLDELTDAALAELGYGLYTGNLGGAIAGGVQDAGPVPPSTFIVNGKGRLFAVSGDDQRTIFYSRFFVAGEAPAFPPAYAIYLSDQDEAATALAILGDKLLVFTATRIYFVYGEGPNDAGVGGFSEPVLFSDALGCTNPQSVAVTPAGVVFQASDDGLYLAGSVQAPPQRISGPVEDTLSDCTVRSVHVDVAREWVVWTTLTADRTARFLVYSFGRGAWVRWTPDAGHGQSASTSCLWRGKHVYGARYDLGVGMVAVESRGYRDRTLNQTDGFDYTAAYANVRPSVQTPWLRVGALNGYQRVRRVTVRGVAATAVGNEDTVRVTLDHDEEDGTAPQSFTYALATTLGLPRVGLHGHVARQKCSSVRVTVDLLDGGQDAGTKLTAITLELAGLRGMSRVSKANKAGNGALWANLATRHRAQRGALLVAQRSGLSSRE